MSSADRPADAPERESAHCRASGQCHHVARHAAGRRHAAAFAAACRRLHHACPPTAAPPCPADCPGTQSEEAGKAAACAGCPNQAACATAPKGPDPDLAAIAERLAPVKHIVLVLSGGEGTADGQRRSRSRSMPRSFPVVTSSTSPASRFNLVCQHISAVADHSAGWELAGPQLRGCLLHRTLNRLRCCRQGRRGQEHVLGAVGICAGRAGPRGEPGGQSLLAGGSTCFASMWARPAEAVGGSQLVCGCTDGVLVPRAPK